MTRQKQAVIDALLDAGRTHPTADTIFLLAKKHMPSIALGTVYRNLALMSEAGEILKIPVTGGADRYDMDTARHDHLVCVGCGRVFDVPHGEVIIPERRLPEGVLLIDSEFIFKCICADCRKASADINKSEK